MSGIKKAAEGSLASRIRERVRNNDALKEKVRQQIREKERRYVEETEAYQKQVAAVGKESAGPPPMRGAPVEMAVWKWLQTPSIRLAKEEIMSEQPTEQPTEPPTPLGQIGPTTPVEKYVEEKPEMKELLQPADDDSFEEVSEEVTENDLGEEEEPVFDVGESDLGETEEVVEEVSGLKDLPSDEEVASQIHEEEAFEDESPEDGRLAGLADDVEIDENEAKDKEDDEKDKPKEGEWDGKPDSLLVFVNDQIGRIPRHRGSMLGCQRAHSFLDGLLRLLSQGIRKDTKGEVDEGQAENLRVKLLKDMAALDGRIKMLSDQKYAEAEDLGFTKEAIDGDRCENCGATLWDNEEGKKECLMCNAEDELPGLDKSGARPKGDTDKEATVHLPSLVVTPFIDAVTDVMINSKVSAGRDMEETFQKLAKKYKFTDREKLEVIHILMNKGYPITPIDRGRIGEGDYSQDTEDNIDWIPNYWA